MKTSIEKIPALFILVFFVGTTSAFAQDWTFDFNFDEGTPGEKVTAFSDAAGHTYYNDDVAYSGNSAQMNIQQGATGWGVWGGRRLFPSELSEGDDVWIRLRTFFPGNFNFKYHLGVP